MTIEKEAREIVERTKNRSRWDMENQTYVPETFPWLEKDIAKALQTKQDRIEELEKKLGCDHLDAPYRKLLERVEELESALKEIINSEDYPLGNTEVLRLAKKAIGGGK